MEDERGGLFLEQVLTFRHRAPAQCAVQAHSGHVNGDAVTPPSLLAQHACQSLQHSLHR